MCFMLKLILGVICGLSIEFEEEEGGRGRGGG